MSSTDVAIVGMACVFPGAPDLETFWRNVVAGVDAITEVPASRWDGDFYDPDSSEPDRFYCRRGGFVDRYTTFDPVAFGIPPSVAEGTEPDQLLTLRVAGEALADGGYAERPFPRDRTAVILGRGGYVGAGARRVEQLVPGAQQLVELLRSLLPDLTEDQLDRVRRDFLAQFRGYGPDTAIGLVPNLAASRIANRLDLEGPAYTIDAACASSLIAVELGCRELGDRTCDMVIAGGVHLCHEQGFWSVFSQLGALSRSEQIRPFDRRADGLLIGEGVGILVLKRREDAERDDDRIYAVIRGIGVSSDGRGTALMTPSVEGQLLALERAWQDSGLEPSTVGLVEAHGTGTPAGDAAELETLARFFGTASNGHRAGLGSVKSMIGHAMPAAGAAGLIKAALAVYHGVLPPTLHCEEPHPMLERTRFRPVTAAEEWNGHRRAGVNAFGFGGINAHVILDAPSESRPRPVPRDESDERILVLAAETKERLLEALDTGGSGGDGAWRLAVADPTPERLTAARAAVERGAPRHGRDGIYFARGGLISAGGKIAFLFPGVEAVFEPRVADVARHFDRPLPANVENPADLEQHGKAVVEVSRLLNHALSDLGLQPDVIAGHSIGEWTGMVASGMISDDQVEGLLAGLRPGTLEVPDVVYAAFGCGAAEVEPLIGDLPSVHVSHDNCPHQSIVCGDGEEVEEVVRRLRARRVLAQVLPFRSGFHSPLFDGFLGMYRDYLASMQVEAPRIPLWSATTCLPYPADEAGIRELHARHLVEPVRFRELVLALHRSGVRVFVQVGVGNLIGFIDDTLRGMPHHAIATNIPHRTGLGQLRRAATALFVEGAHVRLERLGIGETHQRPRSTVTLTLGVPLARLERPLAVEVGEISAVETSDPVLAAFQASLGEVKHAQQAVVRAFADGAEARALRDEGPLEIREQRTFSLAEYPELRDHSFFTQPPGWPHLEDLGPAIPMTMSISIARELARRISGKEAVAVEHVRAIKWIFIEPPAELTLRARYDGESRVEVAIEGHFEAVVRVADHFPDPPAPDLRPLTGERRPPVTAAETYSLRWAFHGPAYQGVVELDRVADDGMRGVVEALPAPGALLDAAGQIAGIWVASVHERDRMAMPVRIDRIEFFAPEPTTGERLGCIARLRHGGKQVSIFDIELLLASGALFARATGWQDFRFETDEVSWALRCDPARSLLAQPRPEGFVLLDLDGHGLSRTEEYLLWRFLGRDERAEMALMPAGRRTEWLRGRIAVKDAVRRLLFELGHPEVFPIEIRIGADASGRPTASSRFAEDIRVSIAHKDGVAVALATIGRDTGIDLETIQPRDDAFVRLSFAPQELELLPDGDRDEWLTRLWAAKEAAAKAAGTGIRGLPREIMASAVEGERFEIDGSLIETRRLGDRIVAWTVASSEAGGGR